jgi:hypothetical protein
MTNCRRDTWRDDEGRDRRVKALARVGDKKELAKSTKNSRERIRGAEENLTLDYALPSTFGSRSLWIYIFCSMDKLI